MQIKLVPDIPLLYTEEYIVKYRTIEDGLEVSKEKSYFATVKGAHEKVAKVFKSQHPKCEIVSVKYQ